MLYRRIVVYSQPLCHVSHSVIVVVFTFSGTIDAIVPTLRTLDVEAYKDGKGLPFSIFKLSDCVLLKFHAPLLPLSQLITNHERIGCLICVFHNVGLLMSSEAAAHVRRLNTAQRASLLAHASKSPL